MVGRIINSGARATISKTTMSWSASCAVSRESATSQSTDSTPVGTGPSRGMTSPKTSSAGQGHRSKEDPFMKIFDVEQRDGALVVKVKPVPFEEWKFGPNWPGRRCGAHSRRTGKPCLQPAMKNGRCRLHGGKSTGPRTEQGKLSQSIAAWYDGTRRRVLPPRDGRGRFTNKDPD